MYKLRDWIPAEKLNWEFISTVSSESYFQLIKSNLQLIDWQMICFNTNQDIIKMFCEYVHTLTTTPDMDPLIHEKRKQLNWFQLSKQPAAIKFLEANPSHIVWPALQRNPAAIHLLEASMNKLDYEYICRNPAAMNLIRSIDLGDGRSDWWKCWLSSISKNPSALHLFEENLEYISWLVSALDHNPEAIHLLRKHKDKIKWHLVDMVFVCNSPVAVQLIEVNQPGIDWNNDLRSMNYRNCVDWIDLSCNPGAIHLIEANLDKIDWNMLSLNPNAIHILEANLDKIKWNFLSCNPNAIQLLEANINKIDWSNLSSNSAAIQLLENNLDKVDWTLLSGNHQAIHILKANIDKIDWKWLSYNTNILEYDYQRMKQSNKLLHDELMRVLYHPDRIAKWIYKYGMDIEYLESNT